MSAISAAKTRSGKRLGAAFVAFCAAVLLSVSLSGAFATQAQAAQLPPHTYGKSLNTAGVHANVKSKMSIGTSQTITMVSAGSDRQYIVSSNPSVVQAINVKGSDIASHSVTSKLVAKGFGTATITVYYQEDNVEKGKYTGMFQTQGFKSYKVTVGNGTISKASCDGLFTTKKYTKVTLFANLAYDNQGAFGSKVTFGNQKSGKFVSGKGYKVYKSGKQVKFTKSGRVTVKYKVGKKTYKIKVAGVHNYSSYAKAAKKAVNSSTAVATVKAGATKITWNSSKGIYICKVKAKGTTLEDKSFNGYVDTLYRNNRLVVAWF